MNKNFYPTPENLISKMIKGINFSEINTILEPSAGKGDICDYIKKTKDYLKDNLVFDVIEIDEDLQLILKGKKYNLVFNDFLEFSTNKKYDLIIANFPFSDGDKHLYRAIKMIENGGNLVCLVNAETLKNPYSNLRKLIINILKKNNASIEYLENEFIDAERKTNVEVALIKLSIEEKNSSLLLENLIKSENIIIDEEYQNKIVEKDLVKNLITRFNFESKIGIKIINEYCCLKPFITNDLESEYKTPLIKLEIDGCYSRDNKSSCINNYIKGLRRKYWKLLIRNENFRQKFTSNLLSELERKLIQLEDYDFNEFNIKELEKELILKVNISIEDTILKLFDEFSYKHAYNEEFNDNIHYFNGWKTNKAHRINKKVIIPFYGYSDYSWDKNKLEKYRVAEKMKDIVKVFNYLSNEINDIPQLVGNSINCAINYKNYNNIDLHFFITTFYKKGTCHIKFLDEKLLDKFNIFGSQRKGWLPPSYGKKKYSEMDEEEKSVINEFQGKEKYNEVMSNSDYYIYKSSDVKLIC